jgi:hypothetical protein
MKKECRGRRPQQKEEEERKESEDAIRAMELSSTQYEGC